MYHLMLPTISQRASLIEQTRDEFPRRVSLESDRLDRPGRRDSRAGKAFMNSHVLVETVYRRHAIAVMELAQLNFRSYQISHF